MYDLLLKGGRVLDPGQSLAPAKAGEGGLVKGRIASLLSDCTFIFTRSPPTLLLTSRRAPRQRGALLHPPLPSRPRWTEVSSSSSPSSRD